MKPDSDAEQKKLYGLKLSLTVQWYHRPQAESNPSRQVGKQASRLS